MRSEIEMLIEDRVVQANRRGGFTQQDYAHLKSQIVHQHGHGQGLAEAACSLIPCHGPGTVLYYTMQEVVGRLLEELQPATSVPLELAISQVVDSWNPSVEQYPRFLRRKYGEAAVLSLLTEIERRDLSERGQQAVKTMRWWLTGKV